MADVKLPSGFIRLEYIESDGAQYINTGLNNLAQSEWFCDFAVTDWNWSSAGSQYLCILGACDTVNNIWKIVFGHNKANAYNYYYYTESGLYSQMPNYWMIYTVPDNKRHTLQIEYDTPYGGRMWLDGIAVNIGLAVETDTALPLFLFARNENGTAKRFSKMRCYSLWGKRGGYYVINAYPARRISDGAVGMYDLKTDTFLTNSGTGKFIAGPAVVPQIGSFSFAGKETLDDFGLLIEQRPTEEGGNKILNTFSIPGRTGTLTLDTGAISNVTRSYNVAFKDTENLGAKMRAIRAWLAGTSGYVQLIDTYDGDVFRLARVVSLGSFENIMQRYGRGVLSFDCDPRRFLFSGLTPITAAGSITNPGMPSRPRISLSASSSGTAVIGGTTITVTTATSSIIIDSESRVIEAGADKVSFADFPVIPSGDGTISVTGGVSIVGITPRWWQP